MLERVVTSTSTTVTRSAHGFCVHQKVDYCESSIGGGSTRSHTDVYERLTRQELQELIERLADGPVAGEQFFGGGLQLALL